MVTWPDKVLGWLSGLSQLTANRWPIWGPDGLDLIPQRSGVGAVPGCAEAGLPRVAEGVQGQWEGQIWVASPGNERRKVHKGVWKVRRGCAEGVQGAQKGVQH